MLPAHLPFLSSLFVSVTSVSSVSSVVSLVLLRCHFLLVLGLFRRPFGLSPEAGLEEGEAGQELDVVVGGDAVVALLAAAEAAVDEHGLAAGAVEAADGGHLRAAGAGAVAGATVVHMPRVQAERAVVAVFAAEHGRADQDAAVAAAELLAAFARGARRATARGRLLALAFFGWRAARLVVAAAVAFAPGELRPGAISVGAVVVVLVEIGGVERHWLCLPSHLACRHRTAERWRG
jgi:hypothetical protein